MTFADEFGGLIKDAMKLGLVLAFAGMIKDVIEGRREEVVYVPVPQYQPAPPFMVYGAGGEISPIQGNMGLQNIGGRWEAQGYSEAPTTRSSTVMGRSPNIPEGERYDR